MKTIKKTIFLTMCSLSMTVIAAPSNTSLYENLYRLAEKTYYLEYTFSPEQRKMVEELSNQIEAVLSEPNDITCGTKTSVFQEAYKWAYSRDGLDSTSSEAEKFATNVVNKFCPAAYLKVFKLAYKFAYITSGMDKTRAGAQQVATKISDYDASVFYVKNTVQCYIDNYNFAYSSSGMNRTRAESEVFADQQCLQH